MQASSATTAAASGSTTTAATGPRLPGTCRRHVVWVGGVRTAELAWSRTRAAEAAMLTDLATPMEAPLPPLPAFGVDRCPDLVCLASDFPGRWLLADAVAVSRRWPLAPIISVTTSLADGRRRSGPPLPGVEEVAWSDLPGRLAWWFVDIAAGRPGTLGLPATARREDRVLEVASRLRSAPGRVVLPWRLSVAARRSIDVDGTADLLAAAGHPIVNRICGRPSLDEPADALVWDVETLDQADLVWLRMLSANRPHLTVLLLDSFPSHDTTMAALDAGAAAVLARPVSLESLAGTLVWLKTRPQTGSPVGPHTRPPAGLGPTVPGS